MHIPGRKYVYIQIFRFVSVMVIEIRELRRRTWQNREIPYYKYYTGFTRFCGFFLNTISFQHVLHFGVGKSQIDWNMKVNGEIVFVHYRTF